MEYGRFDLTWPWMDRGAFRRIPIVDPVTALAANSRAQRQLSDQIAGRTGK
jgi:hypothetical protein